MSEMWTSDPGALYSQNGHFTRDAVDEWIRAGKRKLLESLMLSEEQIVPLLTADIGRIIVDGEPAIQVDDRFTSTLLVTFPYQFPYNSAPEVMLIEGGQS